MVCKLLPVQQQRVAPKRYSSEASTILSSFLSERPRGKTQTNFAPTARQTSNARCFPVDPRVLNVLTSHEQQGRAGTAPSAARTVHTFAESVSNATIGGA